MTPTSAPLVTRGPRLLIPWEPRWHGFVTSFRILLHRCHAPKLRTIPAGIPARSPLSLILLHFALLFCVLSLEPWLRSEWQTLVEPRVTYRNFIPGDVVYLPQGLPELSDVAGAEAGRSGKAGGAQAHHPDQVIRIARDRTAANAVVDAPTLQLPRTEEPVANLVAFSAPHPLPPAPAVQRPRLPAPVLLSHAIVAPAPSVHLERLAVALNAGPAVVVAPPPAVERTAALPRLLVPDIEVVSPAPDVRRDVSSARSLSLAAPVVVPPAPAQIPRATSAGTPNLPRIVLPPAPTDIRHEGGRRVLAHMADPVIIQPPTARPATANDVVMSTHIGERVGAPAAGPGALAMSPKGDSPQGIGRAGAGSGIGRGDGPAAGHDGNGPGATTVGDGRGADLTARGGINHEPGPGGTGTGAGQQATWGVTISGGVVRLPSFGSGDAAEPPGRGPEFSGQAPAVVVIASPRAGGALNPDLAPQGARVYTIYLATRLGTVVLQYADPDAAATFQADLVAPQPIRTDIPSGVEMTRAVMAGIIDRWGILRNLRILRADQPDVAAKLMEALRDWRFRPVLRRNSAIDVNAVVGFGITTK